MGLSNFFSPEKRNNTEEQEKIKKAIKMAEEFIKNNFDPAVSDADLYKFLESQGFDSKVINKVVDDFVERKIVVKEF